MNMYWSVKGSFAVVVIAMFLEVILPLLIFADKRLSQSVTNSNNLNKQQKFQNVFQDPPKVASKTENIEHNSKKKEKIAADSSNYKPRQLSAAELDEHFSPYVFDNVGYFPSVSVKSSASSLVNSRQNTSGRAQSLQPPSTVVTCMSAYQKYTVKASLESLV